MLNKKEMKIASLGRLVTSRDYLCELQHWLMSAATVISMEDEEMLKRTEMIKENLQCIAEYIEILRDQLHSEIEKEGE